MNPRYTSVLSICAFALAQLVGQSALSQSSQYKREKPKAPVAKKADGKSAEAQKKAPSKNGKVDISGLEEKYWTSKDTEFKVVQNRLYTKEKRIGVSLGVGPIVNDGFSVGNILTLGGSYYFSERMGVEAVYSNYMLSNSKMTSNFINRFGARPDFNTLTNYYGVKFNWVPIYAKLSWFDSKILYFDFIFSPGLGLMEYNQHVRDGSDSKTTKGTSPVVSFDVTQQVYVHKNWAIRLQMENRFLVSEEIKQWNNPDQSKTDTQMSTSYSLGVVYYFGDGGKK